MHAPATAAPTPEELARDLALLARDRYHGDAARITADERARLACGEPLAYLIGWVPFLAARVRLDSRPLIPRPETEWWTERLIRRLAERFPEEPFTLLDLCAGSGCIGIAVLKALPNAQVAFAELDSKHRATIERSLAENGIATARASVRIGNLFEPLLPGERFDAIAANPPYIPAGRPLPASVAGHEPAEALFAGPDGLDLVRRIAAHAAERLRPGGELWMECDLANAEAARELLTDAGAAAAEAIPDQFGRPRLVLAYF